MLDAMTSMIAFHYVISAMLQHAYRALHRWSKHTNNNNDDEDRWHFASELTGTGVIYTAHQVDHRDL